MLQVPPLPTDNLYKLMSIGGLVTAVAAVPLLIYAVQIQINDETASRNELHKLVDEHFRLALEKTEINHEIALLPNDASESVVDSLKDKASTIDRHISVFEKRIDARSNADIRSKDSFKSNVAFLTSGY